MSSMLALLGAAGVLLLRCAAAAPAASLARSSGSWSPAFPGRTFVRCPDLRNLVGQNVSSCEAACDADPRCNAINLRVPEGPCALRACPCGTELAPTGNLSGFSAYRRNDEHCPPAPLFANVFGSGMVLQRGPMQARLFGLAPPGAVLTVAVARQQGGAHLASVTTTAGATGEWACLLPAMPASGGSTSYSLTASLDTAPHHTQVLTRIVWGDVFVCGGQVRPRATPVAMHPNQSLGRGVLTLVGVVQYGAAVVQHQQPHA
jgi:hypothetical protein